jgi:predicted transcriptional regulator
MDELWATMGHARTVREVSEHLPSHAYTTILTVLDRLERKGFVHRQRDARAHRYSAISTREEYTVSLMREALVLSTDQDAALVRFAETASPEEVTVLRHALAGHNGSDPSEGGLRS